MDDLLAGRSLRHDWCNDRTTKAKEGCEALARASLRAAVRQLGKQQGDNPATWAAPADHIAFDEIGAARIPPIPWQNRGTFNQAVEVLSGR